MSCKLQSKQPQGIASVLSRVELTGEILSDC